MGNRKKIIITKEEIQKAYQFQLKNSDWTFYSEREFVEYILSQRFNYLVLLYSLFITAFAMIRGENNKIIVLFIGFLVVSMMGLTIYRVYVKLMLNLEILDNLGDMHAFHFIRTKVNKKKWYALFKVNPIIGKWLPLFFSISLLVALLLIVFDLYHFET